MRADLTLTGMVVSAIPIGEFDKRLVILTRERGKIHAFARNARRQNSPLMACSQPFTFGEFTLYEGKTAYNLVGAQIQNYFPELRQDLERIYYGFYFLELSAWFAKENLDATEELKLLYQSFRALTSGIEALGAKLVRYIFEWKILAVEGMMPQMFECAGCGRELSAGQEEAGGGNRDGCRKTAGSVPEDAPADASGQDGAGSPFFFSCRAGGLVCAACRTRFPDAIPISKTAVYTLQYIGASTVGKLYTFTIPEETVEELGLLAKRYYQVYVDQEFHSLELLGT